jgi:uncharacterized protein YecT (DUF1311 family)
MKRTATLLAALAMSLSAQAQLTAPPGVLTPGAGASQPAPSAPPPSAPAQADPMTKEFRDCVQASKAAMAAKGQTDFNLILGCLTAELKQQEGKLSRAVANANKQLTAAEKKRLEEASAAWRKFRDANCAFYADPKAPPPGNLENTDCLMNLTIGRGQEMEALAQNAARRNEANGADAKKDAKKGAK